MAQKVAQKVAQKNHIGAQGFTLIELVVTVAIIAILATAAFPLGELTAQRLKERELRQALWQIREGLDAYKRAADAGRIAKAADGTGYPHTLDELAAGVEDIKSPVKSKIYFLRRLPRDPMTVVDDTAKDMSAASSWGLRSYASPPDAPAEGDDVFDVYSRSSKIGLNSVPYREW